MKQVVRWGILGPGAISRSFASALHDAEGAELVAVGSRSRERAERFAGEFDVTNVHGTYDALASDPEVDAIYIGTPHAFHEEHAVLCLRHGKHVLCEKPLAVNALQAARMIRTALENDRLLMEAMWTRFLPSHERVRQVIADGAIGTPRILTVDIGFRAEFVPSSRLFDPRLGGGTVLDLGVYPVSMGIMLFGRPAEALGSANLGEESFWDPEGAQFLVSTSAGGEGINLQVCHIVFNYDLPWNPMAVEQRIGRIHRYGQRDTAQVYNLVAEDTVEERIYGLLEQKLLDIAQTIGRIDPVTGQVTEDFRSEILGFLGSSPNYQDLYKKALVDKDYRRTEREITEAVERARQASEALRNLTQGLDAFNLEDYRQLQGHYTLDDLQAVFTAGILRLGGAVLPEGELLRVEVPECLCSASNLKARYENVTFDRALAMRTRRAQFFGLGHPLVDALIEYLRGPRFRGETTVLPGVNGERRWSVRFLVKAEIEGNRQHVAYEQILIDLDGAWKEAPPRADIEALRTARAANGNPIDAHGIEGIAEGPSPRRPGGARASGAAPFPPRRRAVGQDPGGRRGTGSGRSLRQHLNRCIVFRWRPNGTGHQTGGPLGSAATGRPRSSMCSRST